jgi:hypothetical protein
VTSIINIKKARETEHSTTNHRKPDPWTWLYIPDHSEKTAFRRSPEDGEKAVLRNVGRYGAYYPMENPRILSAILREVNN